MGARNHAPSRRVFRWIPRAILQRGNEDNLASDAARAATSPDAGTMGNSLSFGFVKTRG